MERKENQSVKFLKNAKTIDFTKFQGGTPVFLIMYRYIEIKRVAK
ncbi:hypothetical protein ACTNBF_02065 [Bariatricus sp. HCP28S3_A4]